MVRKEQNMRPAMYLSAKNNKKKCGLKNIFFVYLVIISALFLLTLLNFLFKILYFRLI